RRGADLAERGLGHHAPPGRHDPPGQPGTGGRVRRHRADRAPRLSSRPRTADGYDVRLITRGLRGAWPLAVVGSLSVILGQLPASQWLGPYLPDIIGAVVCFGALLLLLRFWRPKETLGFGGVPVDPEKINSGRTDRGELPPSRDLRADTVAGQPSSREAV